MSLNQKQLKAASIEIIKRLEAKPVLSKSDEARLKDHKRVLQCVWIPEPVEGEIDMRLRQL